MGWHLSLDPHAGGGSEEVLDADRQVADPLAGSVMDRIGDRAGRLPVTMCGCLRPGVPSRVSATHRQSELRYRYNRYVASSDETAAWERESRRPRIPPLVFIQ